MSNTIHDMGGMHGFGPIEEEENEPIFHTEWESRVYAMNRAMGPLGLWTIDEGRAAQEMLPPSVYLSASYYQRWYLGLVHRVLDHGIAGADEIAAGKSLRSSDNPPQIFKPKDAEGLTRGSFERPSSAPPQFKPNDTVRTRNIQPTSHTRLPRYARDKLGTVEAIRGCHVYPDSVTTSADEDPQWLYTVAFSARNLWGENCDTTVRISIEAFEPYLELA